MPGNEPLDLERLRSIGHVRRLTRARVQEEGHQHPESGEPFKTVRDENGNDVTEHGKAGSGVSDRQDVHIYQQAPVTATIEVPHE